MIVVMVADIYPKTETIDIVNINRQKTTINNNNKNNNDNNNNENNNNNNNKATKKTNGTSIAHKTYDK